MCLKNALDGLAQPFQIPGTDPPLYLNPDVFITVIVWTPFLTLDSQLVLCQGWRLTPDNVQELTVRTSDDQS